MDPATRAQAGERAAGVPLAPHRAPTIPVFALGMALALFFVITYALCVLFYLLFPDLVLNHAVLALFLPGFKLLSWPSFFLGLVESFGYGWYVALVFGPLYNFFAARSR
jgi:hypothetical protein